MTAMWQRASAATGTRSRPRLTGSQRRQPKEFTMSTSATDRLTNVVPIIIGSLLLK
jgi:hypothetical protein